MGSLLVTERIQGFGIPAPEINEDNITDQGAGNTDSSFSQEGARAGRAVADQTTKMHLSPSGDQTDHGDIEIYTIRAGFPGTGGLSQFLYRDVAAGDTTVQRQGWDCYSLVTGSESIFRSAAGSGGGLPEVKRLADGTAVMAHHNAADGARKVQVHRYDPATSAWSNIANLLLLDAIDLQAGVCLVELLPEERLLLFYVNADGRNINMGASDDGGATWGAASSNGVLREDLPAGITINEVRGAYNNGQVILFVQYTSATAAEEIAQYASTSRGARFDQVFETWDVTNKFPDSISVTALTGGGFLLAYSDADIAAPRYRSRRIGTAYENVQDSDSVQILSGTAPGAVPSITVWEDEDGILYAIGTWDEGGTSSVTRIFRSTDRGDSWQGWGGPLCEIEAGSSNTELNEFAATSTGALGLLVTRYTAPNDAESDSAVVCVYLGGSSDHTVPATNEAVGGDVRTNYPDIAQITWGQSDDNGKMGGLWLPIEEPQNCGWTLLGVDVGSIILAQQLEISTDNTGRCSYYRQTTATDLDYVIIEFELEVEPGDGDETLKNIAAEIVLSDYDGTPGSATFTYAISARFADDKWRLYDDNAAASIGEVTVDSTTPIKVRIALESGGKVLSWYGRQGQRKQWTEGPSDNGLTNTPADVPNEVQFGNIAIPAVPTVSRWIHFGYCFWPWRWAPGQNPNNSFAAFWLNPSYLHGRPFPVQPALVHDGVRLSATGGPSYVAETWRITPEYDYGIDNLHPSSSPSPREPWRSTGDGVEQLIVWEMDPDFASTRLQNYSLVVLALNSNLETFFVEGWNGAAWETIASPDSTSDWSGLIYDRRGATLMPQAGAATVGERNLWYQIHKGDTFDLNIGEADDLHKIKSNTEGVWRGVGNDKKPTIVLERDNLPGALADQNFGTGLIRRKDFGEIVHSYDKTDHQYIRVRIPAQKTADGYYQIGTLVIGHIVAFAHEYDLGRSIIHEHDTEVFRRRGGGRRGRKLGPSRRVVEIAWANTAVDLSRAQAKNPDPDWIAGQTGVNLAIGTPQDTIETVVGAIEAQDGPVLPVVYLARILTDSSAAHAMPDSKAFVYGRVESNPRIDNVTGDENLTELNRLNTITVREEK